MIQYGIISKQMAGYEIRQTQSVQMHQGLKQIVKMQQASLLQMPEEEFQRLIVEIEQSSFFLRLYRKENLIHYQRFPRTNISSTFYQFKEEVVADTGSLNIESLLLHKENIVRQVQKLGLERFKRYFLFPEIGMTLEEIARECDLGVSEVQEINSLIDEFSIMSEFYHPSNFTSDVLHYYKVASLERGEDGFVISYFSPSFARGRYLINYERFEELNSSGTFSKAEEREARQLFKKLELINSCKDTINQILQNIIKKQALYFESGNLRSLLPFSQKELAKGLGLAPSSVSRAISGKSIDTPWGEEIPLRHFFPRPRQFRKEIIRQLLENDSGLSSDEAIRTKLWEKFGVAISRRLVANLRKELKIPAIGRKKR
jgi:DNA-directed RNA polymerase specialized sigma54-like protein